MWTCSLLLHGVRSEIGKGRNLTVRVDNNLNEKTGVSLENSTEWVKQTWWVCLSWTKVRQLTGARTKNLYSQFKMWKQRWKLLFTGPMAKIDKEIKCKRLLYRSGEQGIELFNSCDLSADKQKKLDNYWERFQHFVKPHSNDLTAAWGRHNLRQGTLSLEEFIAKLTILVKDTEALKISDKTPTLAQVNQRLVGIVAAVHIPHISTQQKIPHAIIVIK